MNNHSSLLIQNTTSSTVEPAISGTGEIKVQGSGELIFNGEVQGAVSTVVDAGSKLRGSGTFKALTVNGTLQPGNSIGTMHVSELTLGSGSNTIIELNKTASAISQIVSSGNIQINAGSALTLMLEQGAGGGYRVLYS
jgi:hypothetical protein